MNARRLPAILVLLAAIVGCEGRGMTFAKPENVGQEVFGAIAKVAGNPNSARVGPAGIRGEDGMVYPRGRHPLNLSEVAIIVWSGPAYGDSELAEALVEYVKGEFPGTVMECDPDWGSKSEHACFPLSHSDIPPDGVLWFSIPPVGHNQASGRIITRDRRVVGVRHLYLTAGEVIDAVTYVVELERLENGSWKVGEGEHGCCHQ